MSVWRGGLTKARLALGPSRTHWWRAHRAPPVTVNLFIQSESFTSGSPVSLSSNLPLRRPKTKNRHYGFVNGDAPHSRDNTISMVYVGFLAGMMTLVAYLTGKSVEAASKTTVAEEDEGGEVSAKSKKKRVGFRDKKIIEYENRIRNYSTPDKVFRYFATLSVKRPTGGDTTLSVKRPTGGDTEVYMTPEDFVRSLMPGSKQPEGLGLDQFHKYDPTKDVQQTTLPPTSYFYKMQQHGLISFTDYIFLLTLLATPSRQFVLAFRMFDNDGDGNLDIEEFSKVQSVLRAKTSAGQKHRNHSNTGSVLKTEVTALSKFFFGDKLDQKLPYAKFIEFHQQLHKEVMRLEFEHYSGGEEILSEKSFTEILLAHAGFSEQKRHKVVRRVAKKLGGDEENPPPGISFKEYADFFTVLKCINEIDTALTFYHIAGAAINKETLQHVAKTVSGILISDHIVDIVFEIFDENGDGQLSNREFVSVMKQRMMRGLEKPKETKFFKVLGAVYRCSKAQLMEFAGQPRN